MLKELFKEKRQSIVYATITGALLTLVHIILLYMTVSAFANYDNSASVVFLLMLVGFGSCSILIMREWADQWDDINRRISECEKYLNENRFF